MKTLLTCLLLIAALEILGCAQTVDGTTEGTYRDSLDEMIEDMDPTERKAFAVDLLILNFHFGLDGSHTGHGIWKSLDGMTAEEITEFADEIAAKNTKNTKPTGP